MEHVLSAVVGGVVDRFMSAALSRYEALASVDDQLERLRTLSVMLHSAVEAAEGLHIRSWWLRRWLWTLRDTVLDADEVLRLFRQRRAAEETGAASRQATWNMVWRALRGDDGGVEREMLSRMVARLEREAMGLGDFLKMLELEIRRSSSRDEVVPLKVPDFPRMWKAATLIGEHATSAEAVVGGVVDRAMSAAVVRYEARASVDEQLERLDMMLDMVHSAMAEAERVHIASWWLRRWLWRLRDAALEGDEVLRLCRQRRVPEEATAGTWNALWRAARRAVRSAKRLFFGRDDVAQQRQRLRRTLATLEQETMGLGEFLRMLDLEIKTMPEVQEASGGFVSGPAYDSHVQCVAGARTWLGLLIQRIRRVLDRLIRKPAAQPASCAPPTTEPDTDTLRALVARIRRVVHVASGGAAEVQFPCNRRWLAEWRGELQAVAERVERVLLAAPSDDDAGGDSSADVMRTSRDARDDDLMRRTARSVATAAAHLEDFVALVVITIGQRSRGPPGN